MTGTRKVIAYGQLGGFGTRLAPLLHQPGLSSKKVLSPGGRNILPFNHNSYYAVPKPILTYFEMALSEPLLRKAVSAGVEDVRVTMHNMPDIIVKYYKGRALGKKAAGGVVSVNKYLYEHTPLDTSGGIVRDVVAGIKEGTIKPEDTILVLGGDIRTDVDLSDFLAKHYEKNADVSVVLTEVSRNEMHRFGAAVREGDVIPELGQFVIRDKGQEKQVSVYGDYNLNQERMARIIRFFEKMPRLNAGIIVNPGGLIVEDVLETHGVGALSPTNLQNGSIYALRAELLNHLAPLVFNLSRESAIQEWEKADCINISGLSKFSDFGGDLFPVLTGSKPFPKVNPSAPFAKLQEEIIEWTQKNMPQVFGYKHTGRWNDDGTLDAVLKGHFELLDDLVAKGTESYWPINWDMVKSDYPAGVITMTNFDLRGVNIIPPVFIGPGVSIEAGATIGPYAIINRGWEIAGTIEHSVLFSKKKIDEEIADSRQWRRFYVPAGMQIIGSLIGSGFELTAIDQFGNMVHNRRFIKDSVVVSNGSQNVISPLDI